MYCIYKGSSGRNSSTRVLLFVVHYYSDSTSITWVLTSQRNDRCMFSSTTRPVTRVDYDNMEEAIEVMKGYFDINLATREKAMTVGDSMYNMHSKVAESICIWRNRISNRDKL